MFANTGTTTKPVDYTVPATGNVVTIPAGTAVTFEPVTTMPGHVKVRFDKIKTGFGLNRATLILPAATVK